MDEKQQLESGNLAQHRDAPSWPAPSRHVVGRASMTAAILMMLRDRAALVGGDAECAKRDAERSIVDWDDALANVTQDIIDATDDKQRRDALMRSAVEMLAWVQALDRASDAADSR